MTYFSIRVGNQLSYKRDKSCVAPKSLNLGYGSFIELDNIQTCQVSSRRDRKTTVNIGFCETNLTGLKIYASQTYNKINSRKQETNYLIREASHALHQKAKLGLWKFYRAGQYTDLSGFFQKAQKNNRQRQLF
ncbi:hypothetical protein [Reichenbachiella sp. MALMAid0571]|uniref:hypothetical protein n=1 Tax=Reichenbachiella sp. MALMAid0571 TaxID=3143939 RepID=UPI0032DF18AD